MILDQLVQASRQRVALLHQQTTLSAALAELEQSGQPTSSSFRAALQRPGLSVIAEVKRASPSKGTIVSEFSYRQIARDYVTAGADAISVLTEPDFFHGSLDYLTEIHRQVATPLLRKDFIVDPLQVVQAKQAGASAVLLIVAILTPNQLQENLTLAKHLGLDVLVEAHDQSEIQTAYQAGARIIGINNRNLRDFTVDFKTSIRLRSQVPATCLAVADSGIQTAADMTQLRRAGFDAVLIGETLMRATDKGATLKRLRTGVPRD